MANTQSVRGVTAALARLKALGEIGTVAIPKVIQQTTLLGKAEIQKIITNEIAPHNRDGQIVTDLVDTSHYRANWQTSFPSPVEGAISTNTPYARILEYGWDGPMAVSAHDRTVNGKTFKVRAHLRNVKLRPYYVVRRAKIRIRAILRRKIKEAIGQR